MKSSYYYDAVMLDNPILFLPLDEVISNNTTAVDISSPQSVARNGVYVNNARQTLPIVSGGENGSVIGKFNYLTIPSLEQWSRGRESSPFTFECWALLTEDNQSGVVLLQPFSSYGAIPENYIAIEDNQVIFKISNANNYWASSEYAVAKHDLLEPRMAHHYVFSYSNNVLKVYVDSRLVDSIKLPFSARWLFDVEQFRIYNKNDSDFIIDAVALYKGELSSAAIQRHYLTGRSTIGSQEIARRTNGHFFPIDDLDSKPALDLDWPISGKWPVAKSSKNVVQKNGKLGLINVTSPDTVDENIFFTGGAFQLVAGSKLLSDDMSTFNNGINLLENSSFDVDSDLSGTPDMWAIENTSGGQVSLSPDAVSSQNSLVLSTSAALVGTYLRVSNTSNIHVGEMSIPGKMYGDLPLPIPAPKPYTQLENKPTQMVASFDCKGFVNNGLFNVRVRQWSNGSPLTDLVFPINLDIAWRRKQVVFDLFETTTDVNVVFEVMSGNLCASQVYVDNAMVEFGNSFNKYVDGWGKYADLSSLPIMSRSSICDSGMSALKLECSNDVAKSIGVVSESLPVSPSDYIYTRLSAYCLDSSGDFSINVKYVWLDVNSTPIGAALQKYTPVKNQEWVPCFSIGEAPAGSIAVKVYITLESDKPLGIGQEVVLDNIYINELVEEAAQYIVVEEFSSLTSLSEGSLDLEFYLSSIHADQKKTFVILSLDDGNEAIQVIKCYDGGHKIKLRHIYTLSGIPQTYDIDICDLTEFDLWKKVSVGWMGDEFFSAIDGDEWMMQYDTSNTASLQLTSSFELTAGAGIDGRDSIGTSVRNINVYGDMLFSDREMFPNNYYLPLQDDINVCMSGYAEFWLDFTHLYESVDDVKIEWGPNNSRVKVFGISNDVATELSNCSELLPIKGGYCPSTISQKYKVRVVFNTENLIYKPSELSYMALTFLDDVRFKTKGAGHVIKPTGSYTVASRSTPIINNFYRNGIQFKKTNSKNIVVNGGFNYDIVGWSPLASAMCKIERSVDEYYSGGASLKVTAYKNIASFSNCISGTPNKLKDFINDIGANGFSTLQNCESITTGEVKLISGMPIQRIKKTGSGDVIFGSSEVSKVPGFDGVEYTISLNAYRTTLKPLQVSVDRYDSVGSLIGTESLTFQTSAINSWELLELQMPPALGENSIVIKISALNSDGWVVDDIFYISNIQIELGSPFSEYSIYEGGSYISPCPVLEGRQYGISSRFISDSGTFEAKILVEFIDSSFNVLSNYETDLVEINDIGWTRIVGGFEVPAAATHIAITPSILNTSPGSVIYVDEIHVELDGLSDYQDNLSSGMYLELFQPTTIQSDDGYMTSLTRQQRVGSIEQWVRPESTDSGTVLENIYLDGAKCGVYCNSLEISEQNMDYLFLNGSPVSESNKTMRLNEWNHIVAVPTNKFTIKNYVKGPGGYGYDWSAVSSVVLSTEEMPSPSGNNALSIEWDSIFPPSPGLFSAKTNCIIPPDLYYTISFYIKSSTIRDSEITVDWKNDSTIVKSSRAVIQNQTTGKWVRRYATFRAPGGINNADVKVGVSGGVMGERHYISTVMMSNEAYLASYFDGTTTVWDGAPNNSPSSLEMSWPSFNNLFSKWYWNTSFDSTGQMNASYSNITIHESRLSESQVYDNYISTLSRGTSIRIEDQMSTTQNPVLAIESANPSAIVHSIPTVSGNKISDGYPVVISAPWQVNIGTA